MLSGEERGCNVGRGEGKQKIGQETGDRGQQDKAEILKC
jgi:hypothetical protein